MPIGEYLMTRKASIATLISFLLAISFLSAQDARGLAVVASELGVKNEQVGRQYTVFIGIDKYEHWTPLRNPVKDAQGLRDIIVENYYVDEVIELYDEDATKAGIARTFARLIEETEPSDSVVIFYQGHGYLDALSNSGFWIPGDAGIDHALSSVPHQANVIDLRSSGEVQGFLARLGHR